ncbi:MAG TPA: hypothetical protein DCQ87_08775 [Lachnospiraceae bacterium]|nr:hypothetical protein [Lachnospiraceae bacterium]
MVRIAVCDDNAHARQDVLRQLADYFADKNVEYSVEKYADGKALLSSEIHYDLVFMDYEFEGSSENGIKISEELHRLSRNTTIIFLSAYTDIVYDTFRVGAFRFLIKPLDTDRFSEAMESFMARFGSERFLCVHVDGATGYIREGDIFCIEASGRNCRVYINRDNDPIECSDSFKEVGARLDGILFFRCQRSFIINLAHVRMYKYSYVVLDNGKKIQISRDKYKQFVKRYTVFTLENV